MKQERRTITMYAVYGTTYDRIGRRINECKGYYIDEEDAKRMCRVCGYTYQATLVYADTFGL